MRYRLSNGALTTSIPLDSSEPPDWTQFLRTQHLSEKPFCYPIEPIHLDGVRALKVVCTAYDFGRKAKWSAETKFDSLDRLEAVPPFKSEDLTSDGLAVLAFEMSDKRGSVALRQNKLLGGRSGGIHGNVSFAMSFHWKEAPDVDTRLVDEVSLIGVGTNSYEVVAYWQ